MIAPQSIRKGIIIKFDGQIVDKQNVIKASEEWNTNHEALFKKLLKQGGSFKINGTLVSVTPEEKTRTPSLKRWGFLIVNSELKK